MADIKDITSTIASALSEVGVTGKLDVVMANDKAAIVVGEPGHDDVKVEIVVKPVE